MRKRTVALVFLLLVLSLVAGSLAVLRTRWAGDRICALAAARLSAATGLPLAFGACRIDPLLLSFDAEGVSVGPPGAPVFSAEALSARLAPVQALGRQLHLDRVRLVRPRLRLDLPSGPGLGGTCPPPILARFEVRHLEVEQGGLDLGLPGGGRLAVEGLDVRSRPPARTLRTLAMPGRRVRLALAAGPVRLDLAGRSWAGSRLAAETEMALDLSGLELESASAEVGGARLSARGRIRDLCAPRLDLALGAEGPVSALLGLAGIAADVEGEAALEARVSGAPRAPALSASLRTRGVRVGQFVPGDAEGEVRLAAGSLVVDRLAVAASGGKVVARGTVKLARGLPLEGEADLQGVDLAEILHRLGVTDPWITLHLDGKARVSGTLSPPQLGGAVALDLHDFKVLTRSFRTGAGDPGVLAFARGRVDSAVRVDREGLFFDGARVAAGRGAVAADAAIRFSEEGGFWVRTKGEIDLDALGRIATIPWSGRAQVEASLGAAPYGNPRITGRAHAQGFHFLQVDLGDVAADVAYQDFVLRFEGAEGVRGGTRYRGEAAIDLSRDPTRVLAARLDGRGRLRDVFESVLEWIPRARAARDALDGDVEFGVSASGRADALDARFDARLGAGTLLGRPFDSGRATGRIEQGRTARFETAELRRGTGSARARGSWGLEPPFPWDLELAFQAAPLSDLDLPGGGWAGLASGSAALAGSWEHPRVRIAANGDGVELHGAPLGTVQAAGTIEERRLVVTGGAQGIDVSLEARLEGRLPFHARANLALEDAARLVPGGPPSGLHARVQGEATAEGDLAALDEAQADLTLPVLAGTYADLRVEAAGPARLTLRDGRLALEPLAIHGPNTQLTVGGSAAPGGALDLSAAGTLDLRLLGGVAPLLRRAHGQLSVEAHAGGTADAPVLVGAGRIEDAGLALRGVTVAGVAGPLAFSQNRVLFEDLTGSVNGGRARLRGDVELARLSPARLRLQVELDEVPVAIPPTLPVQLAGRLEAEGTPDATTLTGRLHVLRARYTAPVDLEASLLELRRHPATPPHPYDRADEWLKLDVGLVVDGDARVENDLVHGPVSGELTLTGTLASPGLVGSLAMGPGSRVTFRGNEFNLTHAVLDFKDRHKVEIALDVHGESRVRDYQVLMHVFGSLARPELTLTSTPTLSQPDIVTLLSLGFTRHDTAAGGGVGGVATAAAAQALFSASRLDEQVKRFLPRGGPVGDFSMRVTSAYSEESGQVEPRAEFESWLLRDRLRIRYQAPLGASRGQKAQAELRLGEHTSMQYQWDNENPDVATGDHGVDLKLRWEWSDKR